jgi:aarF domain-containing kinase
MYSSIKATLRHSGEEVAVKLLLPGMESKFRNDIRTMKLFCQFAMPQHVSAFNEVEKQFVTEFDYNEEGKNLDKIRGAMLPKWEEYVDIPKPFLEYSSKHILTMSFLKGKKFVDGIREKLGKLAELQGKTLKELEDERLAQLKSGTFVFKSVEEEKQFQAKLRDMLWWNDLVKHNWVRYAYNYSPLRLIYGKWDYYQTDRPIDLGKTLEILCSIHGYQLFECGKDGWREFICMMNYILCCFKHTT